MKIPLLILAATLLVTSHTHAENSVNIADDFMMKINLDNFGIERLPQFHRNFNFHSINISTCIASTSNPEDPLPATDLETLRRAPDGANVVLFKGCDNNDITQRFTYENKKIKNFLGQCLTEVDTPARLRMSACDRTNGRILQQTIDYRDYFLLFTECNGSRSQEWDLDTPSGDNMSFHRGNRCPTFTGESLAKMVSCGSLGRSNNLVIDSFFVGAENCSLRNQTYSIENPEGGQIILERIIPIVVPL